MAIVIGAILALAPLTQAISGGTADGTSSPPVWKERVMWGCEPPELGDCVHNQEANEAWELEEGSLTKVDVNQYTPAPTFMLEAVMDASHVRTVQVRLVNASTGEVVENTEVSTTSNAPTRVRSSSFDLDGSQEYGFEVRVEDPINDVDRGAVHMVKLLSVQSGADDTVTTVKLSGGDDVLWARNEIPRRSAIWKFDANAWDGDRKVYFEAVADMTGTCSSPCRADVELVRQATGKTVAEVSFGFFSDTVRKRTHDISGPLQAGGEYTVRIDGGEFGNHLLVDLARVIIEQDDLSRTTRYVDLSWQDSTRSFSFEDTGYPAVYDGAPQGAPGEGYFEATMRIDEVNQTLSPVISSVGETASVRLTNASAGEVVEGSRLETTSTSPTRVRTSTKVPLSSKDTEYRAQLRATHGLAEADLRTAWIIATQDGL